MPKSVLFNEQVPRLYYSIGEVCQRFNVAPSRIRFYEEQGIKLHTKRNRKGERMFSEQDLVLVEKTLWLVNKMGVRTDFLKMHLQRMANRIEAAAECRPNDCLYPNCNCSHAPVTTNNF